MSTQGVFWLAVLICLGVRLGLYVDGFNLYYRMLRRNANTKWLDLNQLAEKLFPNDTIDLIKYFTARIKPLDDPSAPQRQLTYLRALETLPNLTVSQWLSSERVPSPRFRLPIPGAVPEPIRPSV